MNTPPDSPSNGSLPEGSQPSSSGADTPAKQTSGLPAYMQPASPLARAAGAAGAEQRPEPDFVLVSPPDSASADAASKPGEPAGPESPAMEGTYAQAPAAMGGTPDIDAPADAEAAIKSAAAEAAAADAAAKAAAATAAAARAAAAAAEAEAARKAAEAAARTEAVAAAVRAKAEAASAAKKESLRLADEEAAAARAAGEKPAAEKPTASKPAGKKPFFGLGRKKDTPQTPKDTATAKPGAAATADSPSFFRSHPVLAVPQTDPPSVGSRLFNALALMPILPLTLLLVAQTIFSLNARDLWYSDEIRHADAFRNLLLHGKGIILELNGQPYPDKPPLYFWFLRGLYELLRTDGPLLHFAGAALSAVLYLWSTLVMGRLVARFDGRGVLASGIVLLTLGYTMGIIHYARMDLLFSALIVGSHVALYQAIVRPRSVFWAVIGFALAALATLTKGPLGIALPLASIILFLLWRGTPLRLFSRDMLAGLIAAAAIIGAWAGAVYMQQGDFTFLLDTILKKQIIERALDTFHHKEPWHYYLVRVPLMLLPWALIVFFVPWTKIFGKNMRSAIAASRTPAAEGLAFLWCMVIASLALLSALSGKIHVYMLPALPAFALIIGRAALQLSGKRAAGFRHTLAFFYLLCGITLLVASLMLFGVLPMPAIKGVPDWQLSFNTGFFAVAAAVILSAFLLWLVLKSSRPEGVLLMLAFIATALAFPLNNLAAPAFNAVLSPKAQAQILRTYMDKGYTAVSYKDYGGTYTYYVGKNIKETNDLAVVAADAAQGKTILAIRKKDWDAWQDRPACFTEVHKQWLETSERLLLACPALPSETAPVQEGTPVEAGARQPETAPEGTGAQQPETAPAETGDKPQDASKPEAPKPEGGQETPGSAPDTAKPEESAAPDAGTQPEPSVAPQGATRPEPSVAPEGAATEPGQPDTPAAVPPKAEEAATPDSSSDKTSDTPEPAVKEEKAPEAGTGAAVDVPSQPDTETPPASERTSGDTEKPATP